jgi:serine protease inhibitor
MSLDSVLTMVYFGASGSTKQEIQKGLKYPDKFNNTVISQKFKSFTNAIANNTALSSGMKI